MSLPKYNGKYAYLSPEYLEYFEEYYMRMASNHPYVAGKYDLAGNKDGKVKVVIHTRLLEGFFRMNDIRLSPNKW